MYVVAHAHVGVVYIREILFLLHLLAISENI